MCRKLEGGNALNFSDFNSEYMIFLKNYQKYRKTEKKLVVVLLKSAYKTFFQNKKPNCTKKGSFSTQKSRINLNALTYFDQNLSEIGTFQYHTMCRK